ncbi:MAG: LacI family transcriptional regulator [Epulopiscium sp.]|nr:LacI family transcriptional regulator [Candidatus Epulonipiscium sp.]
MITIYDVAKEAGVSRSTVSRVLNSRKEVKEETRIKVMNTIEKLNYNPNSAARALAMQANNAIGVVAAGLTDNFYAPIIDAIYTCSDKMGYGSLFCKHNSKNTVKVNYLSILFGKVDGIIFIGEKTVERSNLIRFIDGGYPVVSIFNKHNTNIPGVVNVNIDNFQGGYSATRHLIQLGHKKIAHIIGDRKSFEALDRFEGYKQALSDYGLDIDHNLIKQGSFSFRDGYHCGKELLASASPMTAIFCASDNIAAGFMHAALEKDISIPKDISVVGFDDINQSGLFLKDMPAITTIRQPRNQMAEYAVAALINQINKNKVEENKIFQTELIIRDSTRYL